MSKVVSLFGDEHHNKKNNKPPVAEAILPLIPLSKKKASKNDSPLEKEIRRFNKLIKELQEYEEEHTRRKEDDDEYFALFRKRVLPDLLQLSKDKIAFARRLDMLVKNSKLSKPQLKTFTRFMVDFLQEPVELINEAAPLLRKYLQQQLSLLNKREKEQFAKYIRRQGVDITPEQLLSPNPPPLNGSHVLAKEDMYQDPEVSFMNSPDINKDLQALYKELVRLLHPDLEQDETLREHKTNLMKDLSLAREEEDLYAMLVIKARLNALTGENTITENTYSLEQLKAYNKQLKQKLDEYREEYELEIMNSLQMDRNGFMFRRSRLKAADKIEEQLLELERQIISLAYDKEQIKTIEDVKILIEEYKEDRESQY